MLWSASKFKHNRYLLLLEDHNANQMTALQGLRRNASASLATGATLSRKFREGRASGAIV